MRIVSPLVFAMLLASIGSAQEMPSVPATVAALVPATGPAIVTARFAADEAKQGVAVDARYFYPMSNNRIGKYDKKIGKRVAQWEGSRALYPHMNSCMVDGEDLVCAASNYLPCRCRAQSRCSTRARCAICAVSACRRCRDR